MRLLTILGLVSLSIVATYADVDFDIKPVTLAFVIDTTGSMGNDIKQVRAGVSAILTAHASLAQRLFVNYVVSPYNDPKSGPVTKTYNSAKVRKVVYSLRPRGGGDCPELAMHGIRNAVKASAPGSIVFFFSDATAKDYGMYAKVKAMAVRKKITIVFVMTGCCYWWYLRKPYVCMRKPRYVVYPKLAKATGGALYLIPKNRVHFVLAFIKAALKSGLPALRKLPPTFPALIKAIADLKRAPCAKRPCKGKGVVCKNIGKTRRVCLCRRGKIYKAGVGCRAKTTTTTTTTTTAPPTTPPITYQCYDLDGNAHKVGSTYTSECTVYKCLAGGVEKEVRSMCMGNAGKCKNVGAVWRCKDEGAMRTCKCLKDSEGIYVEIS